MPDESCRKCGGSLSNHAMCNSCKKFIQKRCTKCQHHTMLQIHQHCTIVHQKAIVSVIPKRNQKYTLSLALISSGIFGILLIGFFSLHIGILNPEPEAQATDLNNTDVIMTNPDSKPGQSYANCIAYGSGESITVTCPANNGNVYKNILDMPTSLKHNFSSSVFSIRGLSIVENTDGTVTLKYQMKNYTTKTFGS